MSYEIIYIKQILAARNDKIMYVGNKKFQNECFLHVGFTIQKIYSAAISGRCVDWLESSEI